MSKEVKLFENIRTLIDDNDEVWACHTDLCNAVEIRNSSDALKHCTKKEGIVKHDTLDNRGVQQPTTFIHEDNVYLLLTRSHVPKAEPFALKFAGDHSQVTQG